MSIRSPPPEEAAVLSEGIRFEEAMVSRGSACGQYARSSKGHCDSFRLRREEFAVMQGFKEEAATMSEVAGRISEGV